jgi:hypothetical protein
MCLPRTRCSGWAPSSTLSCSLVPVRHGKRGRDCWTNGLCVIGRASECKAAILLGNDVNLGAGTQLANFKIVPGTITMRDPGGGPPGYPVPAAVSA